MVVTAAACAASGLAAAPAGAVHWPFFGGDSGRSGYQPVDEGVLPVTLAYAKTEPSEQAVRTSILTSTGSPAEQRLIFGTQSGFVHLQAVQSGAPVGPEAGVPVDDGTADADVFGGVAGAPGSTSFADTSDPAGLGQVFAAHNDDDTAAGGPDIEIAQIDEADGALVQQRDVEGTDGFTISSSLVATAPDAIGNRVLFFVAASGADRRLFRIPVTAAGSRTAVIGAATSTANIEATAAASPTIVSLDTGAGPRAYVAVGTDGAEDRVRTYAADDLSAGPVSPDLGGPVQTPSVPVQPSGLSPNPGGPVTTAPLIYVAAATAGPTTTVHKLVPSPGALTPAPEGPSPQLPGAPSPALAVNQEAEPAPDDGKLIVTTGANLYLLTTRDMDRAGTLSRTDLNPGTTGFSQTTAAASGDLVYVANDQGDQRVLRDRDAKPVAADEFAESPANQPPAGTRTAFGQPSISRGLVQYASGRGVFVYRNVDVTPPTADLLEPPEGTRLTGTVTLRAQAFDVRGISSVNFGLNGVLVGTATQPESGSPFAPPGAVYAVQLDTRALRNGEYVLVVQTRDSTGQATLSTTRRVTVRNLLPGACANEASGTAAGDAIDGSEAGDTLFGLAGDDVLRGLAGADCLHGGTGDDRVTGGSGADRLTGGRGADRLSAGSGDDRLFGGAGRDRLAGGVGGDAYSAGAGQDRIEARDGRRETVDCGRGRDAVRADRRDRLRGCERRIA